MKIVTAALLAFMAVSIQAKPLIVGHRGVPFYAPENTTPSMQMALDLGADGWETDIYLTQDKKLMVMHDKTTSRTASGVNHDMKNTPSDVLAKVDVGSYKHPIFTGATLPYLQDIIDMMPKKYLLVIEIKDNPDTVPVLKKTLEASGHSWDEFRIISFNFDSCVAAKKQMPEVEVYYLEGAKKTKNGGRKKFGEDVLKKCKDAGLSGVDLDYKGVTEKLVKQCHEMGMKFYCWTVDEKADVQRMTRFGVDAITTDVADRARRYMEEELQKK